MRGYKATPAALNDAGNQCGSVADMIAGQLTQLKAYVIEVQSTWKGIAPGTFNTLMQHYDEDAQKLNTALRGIGTTLHHTAQEYAAGEDASNSVLAGVMPATGSAPLTVNM